MDPIMSVTGKIATTFLWKKFSTDNIVTRSPFVNLQSAIPLNVLAA